MDEYAAKYDDLAYEEELFRIPERKEYLLEQIGRGKRVLDVGCLGGQITRLIQEQNNEVWGIEINPTAAEVARKRGIRVKVANVEEGLPFEPASFDVVNAGEILEHLYDTKQFLKECWRVLKAEGVLLFSAPNLNSLENRIRVIRGRYPAMVGAYPEDHFGDRVRVFNVEKVQELCRETGFVLEDMRGIFHLEPKSSILSAPLAIAGRMLPGFSKLLVVKARKVRPASA